MASPLADKQAKLLALRQRWALELPERLAAMSTNWREARACPAWGEAHTALLRQAHSLAGAAGTFDFPRLGQVAKRLEDILSLLSRITTTLSPLQAGQIERLLEELSAVAAAGPETPAAPAQPEHAANEATASAAVNQRILIASADATLAEQIAARLGALAWESRICHDATAALAAMAEMAAVPPAAVLVDVVLPEGNPAGSGLLGQLAAADYPHGPLIALSSRWDWPARLAIARSGAAACLRKPIDADALADTLERLVRGRSSDPYRIVVVEDSTLLARHYAQVLSGAGMVTQAVTDPAILLDVLAEQRPELLLMDLYMPGCTGIEAARVIRQDSQYVSLPIVFLSTESGLAQQQEAMQTGADDFLHKPISDTNLIQAVTARVERFRALARQTRRGTPG
ncbi:MAG: response regulator [Gammaproteobacteria bacterium]|nr:response regulator [Rhodocyclaceae bacterium]MBU3909910.1 response regulator [Gammaproteobacteria bacterium]MBU3988938.1 response regulator [Gammaproteobacteria bacterium]MBU4003511.1 response regulator [Gammaproteobacteria bacterium]MBU4020130.1 response regulator [Gammaproteobacteria bacterium]